MISDSQYKFLPWIASLAFFMQTLDISILNTALPSIAKSFGTTALHVDSAIVCYALSVALFLPISGFFADKYGIRNTFLASILTFTLGSLFSALSQDIIQLNTARVIQGIGGAMMVPISRLALLKVFKRDEFLNALNTATMLGLIGPCIGPILGGFLSEKLSWHWIFLINIPIGIIGFIISMKMMPNIKIKSTRLDIKGLILVSASFILIILSLEMTSQKNDLKKSLLLLIIGICLCIIYYRYSKKTSIETIFPIRLFSIKSFKSGIIGGVATRIGTQAIPFLIPLILQIEMGYSAIESGSMLIPLALAALMIKQKIPNIIKLTNYKTTLIYSTILIGFVICTLSLIKVNTPWWIICVILFIIGMINSIRFTGMSTLTLADLYDKDESSGNTMMAVSQQLGITLSIALSSVMVRLLNEDKFSLFYSFSITFLILGLITVISSTSFFILRKIDGDNLLKK